MYHVAVKVEGTNRGLLMHKFSTQATAAMESKVKRTSKDHGSPEAQAEEVAYRLEPRNGDPKGQLMLPGEHFLMATLACGSSFQIGGKGKKTYKDSFKGNLDIKPDYVPLTDETGAPLFEYKIDSRPVRNPSTKGRVVRHRPHIAKWQAEFEIEVVDDAIPPDVIQAALEEAGRSKCVGDYRPRFGSFRIVSCTNDRPKK